MISLSATSFDPNGVLILPIRVSNPYQGERRGNITATLDGNSWVYDTGYSISDQSFTASLRHPSKSQLELLQYLVAYYGEVILCCEVGAFRALLSFTTSRDTTSIKLRLVRRLDT